MSDFHEVLFPTDISYGSSGGPKWNTSVWSADSGFEARVQGWSSTRAEYDVSFGVRDEAQAEALTNFFMCRQGRAFGFRFKDWNDHKVEDVHLGEGDFATTQYQLVKTYVDVRGDGSSFNRPLKKIEWGSEHGVTVNGVALSRDINNDQFYSLDYNLGVLTLGKPMAGGQYHGATPYVLTDFITPAEGGTPSSYQNGFADAIHVATEPGWWFLRSQFPQTGQSLSMGLRKFDVLTAKEIAQADDDQMMGPKLQGRTLGEIVAVSTDGMIFATTGGGNNNAALVKIDGQTLTHVTSWGKIGSLFDWDESVSVSETPGCCSLDGATFAMVTIFGDVFVHRTDTLARAWNAGRIGSGVFDSAWREAHLCPYGDAGYAVAHNRPKGAPEHGCALMLTVLGGGFQAHTWGTRGSVILYAGYDEKTGGVLVMWRGVDRLLNGRLSGSTQVWAALWHEKVAGFLWRRPMPYLNYRMTSGALPLDGEWFARDSSNSSRFGTCLWRLETESGKLERRAISNSSGITSHWSLSTHDRTRKRLITPGVTFSTDLAGIPMDPPQSLDVAGVEFHIGVRFDTDHLNMAHAFWTNRSWDSIPLVEVRPWDDLEID